MTTACSSFFRNTVRASLLAAAVVSPTAFAGPADVPFKAAFTISEFVAFGGGAGCIGSNATGTISGSGNATHLGKATLRSLDCITVTSFPPNLQSTFSSNNLVLQAANGDFLYVTYSGTAMQEGAFIVLNGKFTFNRGTGRFANATGRGEFHGLEDISNGLFPAVGTVMLSGKISY